MYVQESWYIAKTNLTTEKKKKLYDSGNSDNGTDIPSLNDLPVSNIIQNGLFTFSYKSERNPLTQSIYELYFLFKGNNKTTSTVRKVIRSNSKTPILKLKPKIITKYKVFLKQPMFFF